MAAPPELRQYVQCLWVHAVRKEEPQVVHRVLPDGCIDIISGLHAEPTVVGPMTHHELVPIQPGTTIVGARFRPGVAPAFLHCPSSELRDLEAPVHAVVPKIGSRALAFLGDDSLELRFRRLHRLLTDVFEPGLLDARVEAAITALAQELDTPIARLGDSLGISPRQLQRQFETAVGYAPSVFRRVLRLQLVGRAIGQRRQATLARVAAEAGYADQAHMNRDVRLLTGLTPRELLGGS